MTSRTVDRANRSDRWRAVLLVAARELKQHGLQRRFVLATLAIVVLVVGVVVAPLVLQSAVAARYSVGIDPHQPLPAAAGAADGAPAFDVSVKGHIEAEQALRSGELDAYVDVNGGLLVTAETPDELTGTLRRILSASNARRVLAEHHVDPDIAAALVSPEAVPVHVVDASVRASAAQDRNAAAARIAVFLLFGQIATYAFWVASGVVEEKATRVVEIVVSAIRPWQLLAGKVLGLGVLGFVQLVTVAAAGLAAAHATGALTMTRELATASAAALTGYVLGFLLYASLYAAAAATVSRHEELGSVTAVIQGVLMASLIWAFASLEPGGVSPTVASWLPLTSPLVVPPQLMAGMIGPWHAAGSAALLLAAVAAVIPLAARLYSGAVLHTGVRLSLTDAWRRHTPRSSPARPHSLPTLTQERS